MDTTKTLNSKARIELADYKANRYHLDLAESPTPVSLADLMKPSFWATTTDSLKATYCEW